MHIEYKLEKWELTWVEMRNNEMQTLLSETIFCYFYMFILIFIIA